MASPAAAAEASPAAAKASGASLDQMLQDEQQVKRFASYLHANIPLREAVQMDKRVNYFRGKKLIEVLCAGKPAKNKPPCETEEDAIKVGLALLRMGLIHASEVADKKRRILRPIRTNEFGPDSYLTWIYQGSNTMRNMLLVLLIVVVTAMCLFPVWPQFAKVGIWYVAVTILLFLFVLFTVRLLLYIVFWTIGFEFWILPNFFDDDLGVADSFRPVYSFQTADDLMQSYYFRISGAFVLIAFAAWCWQQPTEFDELYAQQMEFLAELYDGKLLGDKPSEIEQALKNSVFKVEELEKLIAEDNASPGDGGDDDDEPAFDPSAPRSADDEVEDVDEDDEALEAIIEADEAEAAAKAAAAAAADNDGEDDEDDNDGNDDDDDDDDDEDLDI
ncbi:Translocation protein sec62 [Hondaea fermentalgiana]|uniref:Translocation protein SEC62 n=1 Tax=Hondaea fermentalgiana TaxID=2315210 RepID=A0A2R5G0F7_9STRA|nr:Translocation protein sec62 [Hondaea fermentalgiana]|eukprot:GBG24516.1 Translocation protein sec62 [Hondaea fermentalgiana]